MEPYNIGQLMAQAFGPAAGVAFSLPRVPSIARLEQAVGMGYRPQLEDDAEHKIPAFRLQVKEETSTLYEGTTWMGTPAFAPVTLIGAPDYRFFDESGNVATRQVADFLLPYSTLVDFNRPKRILKTQVSGGAGSVKEMFSFEDWSIRIRGLCLSDRSPEGQSGAAPVTAEQQKARLLEFEGLCEAVKVSGALFAEKNIHQLVIERLTIRQVEGKPDVIPFEIEATSDIPFELETYF